MTALRKTIVLPQVHLPLCLPLLQLPQPLPLQPLPLNLQQHAQSLIGLMMVGAMKKTIFLHVTLMVVIAVNQISKRIVRSVNVRTHRLLQPPPQPLPPPRNRARKSQTGSEMDGVMRLTIFLNVTMTEGIAV